MDKRMDKKIRNILERLVATTDPYLMTINEEENFYDLQEDAKRALKIEDEKGAAKRDHKL